MIDMHQLLHTLHNNMCESLCMLSADVGVCMSAIYLRSIEFYQEVEDITLELAFNVNSIF